MAEYIPSPRDWVREQVELYESSGGTKGTTLRDTGLPVIIVTNTGNKTGAIRKTPLMRVKDGANYVLVGSQGGAPKDPVWVHNLRAQPAVEIRDLTVVQPMRVREVEDEAERARLWALPSRRFRRTRSTRRRPPGRSRSSSPSRSASGTRGGRLLFRSQAGPIVALAEPWRLVREAELLAQSRHALRADAVAELGLGAVADVDLYRPPQPFRVADLLADRQIKSTPLSVGR